MDRRDKFAWKEGDVVITRADWTLAFRTESGGEGLVQTWDQLQTYLLQNDTDAKSDMKGAFYRFVQHHPMARHMPDKLRTELQSEGVLP